MLPPVTPRPSTSSARSSSPTASGKHGGRVAHAVSPGAERLSAHRPRQVDLPELRRRRRVRRARATCGSTTPTRRRKTSSTSSRSRRTCGGWGSSGMARCSTRPTTSSRCTSAPSAVRMDKAYVDDLTADEIRAHRGTLTEPGTRQPLPQPAGGREPGSVPPDARRRVPRRLARAAREDRHGVAEHQHARPDAVPDPARAPSPHGRCVVHVSDVRLRASDLGRARRHHALALHARVRGSPAALRLGHRHARHRVPPAADRVRAAEPELHGDEQAQAAAAGGGRARVRLGRPAHADDHRHAAARLHAGGDPRVLRPDRRRQEGERRRRRACSSTASART